MNKKAIEKVLNKRVPSLGELQQAHRAAESLGEYALMFEIGNLITEITSKPDRIAALIELIRWGLNREIYVIYQDNVYLVEDYDQKAGWVWLQASDGVFHADPRGVSIYNGR